MNPIEIDWTVLKKKFKDHGLLYHYVNASIALYHASQAYKKFVEADSYSFSKNRSIRGHWTEANRLRMEREEAFCLADALFKDLQSL
jgi:hypothetical protein